MEHYFFWLTSNFTCIINFSDSYNFNNNSNIHLDYYFNIDIHEDLPNFARNLIGFIMKKVFLNLKSFIENIR